MSKTNLIDISKDIELNEYLLIKYKNKIIKLEQEFRTDNPADYRRWFYVDSGGLKLCNRLLDRLCRNVNGGGKLSLYLYDFKDLCYDYDVEFVSKYLFHYDYELLDCIYNCLSDYKVASHLAVKAYKLLLDFYCNNIINYKYKSNVINMNYLISVMCLISNRKSLACCMKFMESVDKSDLSINSNNLLMNKDFMRLIVKNVR